MSELFSSPNPIQSNCIEMLIRSQCKMSAYFDLFPIPCHSGNLYKISRQGKHLIALLCQCWSCPYSKFSTMWVGSRIHIDFVAHKEVCVWLFCEFGVAISARSPAYPRSHHNLGLIMPSCFCNLNIYRAVHQHPQSSTLHLHTDKEANRAERFGINTVCHQHVLTRSWN